MAKNRRWPLTALGTFGVLCGLALLAGSIIGWLS